MKKLLIVSLCISVIAIVVSGVSIGMTINTHNEMKSYYSQQTNQFKDEHNSGNNIDTINNQASNATGKNTVATTDNAGLDIQVQKVFVKSKSVAQNGTHQVEFKIPGERNTRTMDVDAADYNEIKSGQDNQAVVIKDMNTQKVTVYFMTANFKKTHADLYNQLV